MGAVEHLGELMRWGGPSRKVAIGDGEPVLPGFAELFQVVSCADEHPLGAHVFQTPHCPAPKALSLFQVSEHRFDDHLTLPQQRPLGRIASFALLSSQRLVSRAPFDLPPPLVPAAQCPHGASAHSH